MSLSMCEYCPSCLTCCSFFQYLTTVIPYEKKAGTPSVEDLQILTKSEPFSAALVLTSTSSANTLSSPC